MSIATFSRVSPTQYAGQMADRPDAMRLNEIPLPRRATSGSAGYDFTAPCTVTLQPGESRTIPTGIRVRMEPGWVLLLFPRSSLGFKYELRLSNTVGVIDSDYWYADNEGHIMIRVHNSGSKPVAIAKGDRFCQGVFLPYGVADEEKVTETRRGGFGSTDSPERYSP